MPHPPHQQSNPLCTHIPRAQQRRPHLVPERGGCSHKHMYMPHPPHQQSRAVICDVCMHLSRATAQQASPSPSVTCGPAQGGFVHTNTHTCLTHHTSSKMCMRVPRATAQQVSPGPSVPCGPAQSWQSRSTTPRSAAQTQSSCNEHGCGHDDSVRRRDVHRFGMHRTLSSAAQTQSSCNEHGCGHDDSVRRRDVHRFDKH
jgi:hypothetical protein